MAVEIMCWRLFFCLSAEAGVFVLAPGQLK